MTNDHVWLNWKPKWAIPITCCLSSSSNFLYFYLLLKNHGYIIISTKLGTKHPWVNGIQVCTNEWPHPFPRGDNYKIAKIHRQKFSSQEPLGQFEWNLTQSSLWWRGFTNKEYSIIKKQMIYFSTPNQRYDVIIALSKCVYWFILVSKVSDVAHGSLAVSCNIILSNRGNGAVG